MNNIDGLDDVLEQLNKFDFIGPDNRSGTLNRYHICRPRIDVFTQYVYVPCDESVFSCDDDCLTVRKTLKCVECPLGVAIHSMTTLLVCSAQNASVCLVNVVTDKVIREFQKPRKEWAKTPTSVSLLGETVLVCYYLETLEKTSY